MKFPFIARNSSIPRPIELVSQGHQNYNCNGFLRTRTSIHATLASSLYHQSLQLYHLNLSVELLKRQCTLYIVHYTLCIRCIMYCTIINHYTVYNAWYAGTKGILTSHRLLINSPRVVEDISQGHVLETTMEYSLLQLPSLCSLFY